MITKQPVLLVQDALKVIKSSSKDKQMKIFFVVLLPLWRSCSGTNTYTHFSLDFKLAY